MIPEQTRVKLNVPAMRQSFNTKYGQPSRFGTHVRALERANRILNKILHDTRERPWVWSVNGDTLEISTNPRGDGLTTLKVPLMFALECDKT